MSTKTEPSNICAIDASTNSIAFAFYSNKKLESFGKITFEGNDIYQKIGDACRKTKAFFDQSGMTEAIVIEHTVFMNSPKTAADLALIQGAILGAAHLCGIRIIGKVSPMTWQNYIGNKRLTNEEKMNIANAHPDRSKSWLKQQERNLRKSRTIRFVNINFDIKIDDDDIADAIAIGYWANNNWSNAFRY